MNPITTEKTPLRFDDYRSIPSACWVSIALALFQSIAIGICYFISLYFVKTLELDIATAGILLSCYGAGTFSGGMMAGRIVDRYSPKWIALFSITIEAVSFLMLPYLHNTTIIMINLFLLGASVYSFRTANDVWMLANCGDSESARMKAINAARVAMNLGLGISGVIIGTMSDHGFQTLFYFFGAILLILSLMIYKQPAVMTAWPTTKRSTHSTTPLSNKTYTLIITLACLFSVGLMNSQLSSTYPIYVFDSFPTLGMRGVGILYLLDTFLIVFAQAPLINSLIKLNKVLVMGFGAFLMGVGMLILGTAPTFGLTLISCLTWTIGEMLFMPMAQLLCYECSSASSKGVSMGLFQTAYASSTILGPTIGGYTYYSTNDSTIWYLCFLLGVVCLLGCLQLNRSLLFFARSQPKAAVQEG